MLQVAFRSHPEDDAIEQYCLGRLDEEAVQPIEEHLLVCTRCQGRVLDTDLFLKAAQRAAREVRQEEKYRTPEKHFQWFGKPAWIAAGALAAALIVAVPMVRNVTPQNVELSALRGGEAGRAGVAGAGHPLNLRIDLRGISTADCCLIELVDSAGKTLAQGGATPRGDAAEFAAPALGAGRYWVRVKSKPGVALRETGLEVR